MNEPRSEPSDAPKPAASAERQLIKGALFNALGVLGGILTTLWVPLAGLLYGSAAMGGYWVALPFADVGVSFAASGFADAAVVYGSRVHGVGARGPGPDLYRLVGSALSVTAVISTVFAVIVHLSAGLLARKLNLGPELELPLVFMGWAVPPASVTLVLIGLTKTNLRMQESALLTGGVRPVALMICTPLGLIISSDTVGLAGAYLLAQLVTFAAALVVVATQFSLPALLRSTLRPQISLEMLQFALPQSMNLTLNRYNTRIDMIMLAYFSTPKELLGAYGFAAWLVGELRAIRIAFSTAMAPIAARHHAAGDVETLRSMFNRTSRWATALVGPPILLLGVHWFEIFALGGVSGSLTPQAGLPYPIFAAFLLIIPLTNCGLGLAGNLLVYTGHSGYNLLNTALVAVGNTGLNLVLIPRFGLAGAAGATVIAVLAISLLQLLEIGLLERLYLRVRQIFFPYVALVGGVLTIWLGVQVKLTEGLAGRLVLSVLVVSVYIAILRLIGTPETRDLRRFVRPRAATERSEQ